MTKMIVHHQVKDFNQWKPAYDKHEAVRKKSGCLSEQLLRSKDDANDIYLIFEWDNAENAKKFLLSEDLKTTMEKAGVIGKPETKIVDEVETKVLQ